MNFISKYIDKFAKVKLVDSNTISFSLTGSIYNIIPIIGSILILLFFFPFNAFIISGGLEASWILFINSIAESGFTAGKDFFFTYGPLGYLLWPLNIDNHILVSSLFYLFLCFIDGYLLYKLLKSKTRNILNFLLILLVILISSKTNVDKDTFVVFSLMLIMKKIWEGSIKFSVLFIFITALLFLVKFISFYIALSMVIIFIPCNYFFNRNYKQILIMTLAVPLAITFYLLYNPSLSDLFQYIQGAVYISMGMNSAMSLINDEGPEVYIIFVFFFYVACFIYFIFFLKANKNDIALFLIYFSSQFFFFKQGFVRHGGEFSLVGCNILLIILLLSLEPYNVFRKGKVIKNSFFYSTCNYSFLAVIALSLSLFDTTNNPFSRLKSFVPNYAQALNDKGDNVSHLQPEFKSIIENDSFTVFPWELSYGYKQSNFKTMPIIQNYSAYNNYLDKKNADFFNSEEKSPKFIIFNLDAIDGRIPLIETPLTWNAIKNNYELVKSIHSNNMFVWNKNEFLLAKKNGKQVVNKEPVYRLININSLTKDHMVLRPIEATHFSLSYNYGFIGTIAKLVWKLPSIRMDIYFDNGKVLSGRILLETLVSKFKIDDLSNLQINQECYEYKSIYSDHSAKKKDNIELCPNCGDFKFMSNLLSNIDVSKVKYIELKGYGMYFVSKVEVNWYRED